jgi:cytidyltransferase-like protein
MRIYTAEDLAALVVDGKAAGQIVGLCHGCFDMLHTGHIRHFRYAKSRCDLLFVSITADPFVDKGPDRPVFSAQERAEIICELRDVSGVVINHAANAEELVANVRPSIYFKGQEYLNGKGANPNFLGERDLAISLGVDVQYTFEKTDSSSRIIDKLRKPEAQAY